MPRSQSRLSLTAMISSKRDEERPSESMVCFNGHVGQRHRWRLSDSAVKMP